MVYILVMSGLWKMTHFFERGTHGNRQGELKLNWEEFLIFSKTCQNIYVLCTTHGSHLWNGITFQ